MYAPGHARDGEGSVTGGGAVRRAAAAPRRRRRRCSAAVLAFLAAFAALLVPPAGPAIAEGAGISIAIDPTTSPLYVYHDYEAWPPPGPAYAATEVSGVIENCPEGFYTRQMYLTQDGDGAWWTTGSAKGANDWWCDGGPQTISMSFANDTAHPLHPGEATATIELWGAEGQLVATATSTVRIPASAPTQPTKAAAATASSTSATLRWSPPVIDGGSPVAGYRVSRDGGSAGGSGWSTAVSSSTRSLTFNNLRAGSTYTLSVAALNDTGVGPSSSVTVIAGTPGAPSGVAAKAVSSTSVNVTWSPPPTQGASAITGYRVSRDGGTQGGLPWSTTVSPSTRSLTFGRLASGDHYTFSVAALNSVGSGSAVPVSLVVVTAPTAPVIGAATAGVAGGPVTATATWSAPVSDGGAWVHGYVVRALRMSSTGSVLSTTTSPVQPYDARSLQMTLPTPGSYRFAVRALNSVGSSPQSARSNLVAGR